MAKTKEPRQSKAKAPRGKARLLEGKCIACGLCAPECPTDAITYAESGEPIIDLERCIGCRKCVRICPVDALEMHFTEEELRIIEELKSRGEWQ